MRAVIYARYSSDSQRDASIEDQVRLCRTRIAQEGWVYLHAYTDRALSGASTLRPAYQDLLRDARDGVFDVAVAESLDRFSRDQEHVAAIFKQFSFADIKLVTLAEGEITELHVGLKGTMNALYLKDLAQKTWRGLEGRVRQGKSGGGLCYGYNVVPQVGADGESINGEREINKAEAAIVNRIFREYASGRSPQVIARQLNREEIAGPRGNSWGPSTICGNWRRGTGILNNELYIGRLVWNRQRYVKDPATGKRVARPNPEAEWVTEDVPALRIVDDGLWQRVKDRQQITRQKILGEGGRLQSENARRPRYLLSGLLKCGSCGGGFSKISTHHYGCSTARNKGTCDNLKTIRRDELEAKVLDGLKGQLMRPERVKEFADEFHRAMNRLSADEDLSRASLGKDKIRVGLEIQRIVKAIKDGVPAQSLKDELLALERQKETIEQSTQTLPAPRPRLHPNLAQLYKDKIDRLVECLNDDSIREEASSVLRDLIDEIRLSPDGRTLRIEIFGELASLIALAQENPRSAQAGVQVTLVAGARSHLYRTFLEIGKSTEFV